MHAAVKPLKEAVEDIQKMEDEKCVYSPAGLLGRASHRSMIREFSGVMGRDVLGAVRRVAKVEIEQAIGAGSSKRKAEDEDREENAKKARTLLDF